MASDPPVVPTQEREVSQTAHDRFEGAGYYDPQPRVALTRPIVLAGQIGCGARLIARTLAARTGLAFAEIDRLVEHEAGRALGQIVLEEGEERVARWATSVLERVVAQRPFGLIVLDLAWPLLPTNSATLGRSSLVRVERDLAFLQERLEHEVRRAGRWILFDSDARALRRGSLLDQAGIVLDAGREHEHRMAEVLLESLEPMLGAKPV